MGLAWNFEFKGGFEFKVIFVEGESGFGPGDILKAVLIEGERKVDGPLGEFLVEVGGGGLELSEGG